MAMSRRALFVFDRDNWCYVFESVEAAENDLETNDVDADEYVMFDEGGRVFAARVEGVRVRLNATDVCDLAQLHERLARFIHSQRTDCVSEDVIDIANAILKADWEDRWPKWPPWLARRIHGVEPPAI